MGPPYDFAPGPLFARSITATMPHAEEYVFTFFNSLKLLHNAECDSLIKFAYKLSHKALNPSTFERQNVKLALQIFNKFTAEALSSIREKLKILQYGNTNVLIKIILTWWQMVKVKKPWKGKKLRNSFEEPLIAAENLESKQFLQYFLN